MKNKKSTDPNQILIDALEWYADKYNYTVWEDGDIPNSEVDAGQAARKALEEYRKPVSGTCEKRNF